MLLCSRRWSLSCSKQRSFPWQVSAWRGWPWTWRDSWAWTSQNRDQGLSWSKFTGKEIHTVTTKVWNGDFTVIVVPFQFRLAGSKRGSNAQVSLDILEAHTEMHLIWWWWALCSTQKNPRVILCNRVSVWVWCVWRRHDTQVGKEPAGCVHSYESVSGPHFPQVFAGHMAWLAPSMFEVLNSFLQKFDSTWCFFMCWATSCRQNRVVQMLLQTDDNSFISSNDN